MAKQAFGGDWTEDKLNRLRAYLTGYATALKNQPFERMYADAFAGTGYRSRKPEMDHPRLGLAEFKEFDAVAKGSARIALEIEPPFSRYVFIEKSQRKLDELKAGIDKDFPNLADRVEYRHQDANEAIVDLCRNTNWRRCRAVVFLDPFGMQVDWATIEAIARTKAIDMWYLFPAFMGVARMVPRTGSAPQAWEARLDRCLGERRWREVFYAESSVPDLFDTVRKSRRRTFDLATVERYFKGRLVSVFAGVAQRALPLSKGRRVMYLLFFACGNEKGRSVALPIVEHILRP